jgi:hypothetical protein
MNPRSTNRSFLCVLCVLCGSPSFLRAEDQACSFTKIRITDKFCSEGANFADINHDGKPDVISGPFWYEGPDFQKKHQYMEGSELDPHKYSNCFFVFVHDFDGDGWTDIFVVGFPGAEAWWFRNPQSSDGTWEKHLVFPVVDNESPVLGDLTGDAKPELIFNTGGRLGYATPDKLDPAKPWTFHPISPPGDYQRFTHGLGFGDVNGDGRMDILEKGGWWEQPASLEGAPVWKKHSFVFSTAGGAQMYAYDVNGDGRNDVITSLAAHGYGLAWYENIADADGGITFKQHLILSPQAEQKRDGVQFSQLHAVFLADVDGDGLMDIVTGKRFWAHGPDKDPEPNAPAVLYWFRLVRENGTPRFVPHLIDDDTGVGTEVVAGDVSGDGRVDIVVGNKKGTTVMVQAPRP